MKELDHYNVRQYKIPSLPKYENLAKFVGRLNHLSDNQMNRQSFGQQAPKVYFKAATTTDDVVRGKINELMSKITENNQDEIIEQFQHLPFDQVSECQTIASTIHGGIITCYKYQSQFVVLLNYLYNEHPRFNSHLKSAFLEYDKKNIGLLEQLDTEEKFIVKKRIMANYEMIISLFRHQILFEQSDLDSIVDHLRQETDLATVEIFIRLLLNLKAKGVKVSPDIVNDLGKKVSTGDYPKRIQFLIMELA
jgi:hypothetical protein